MSSRMSEYKSDGIHDRLFDLLPEKSTAAERFIGQFWDT